MFGTLDGAWFLVFGVLNAKNLAFSTPDASAPTLCLFSTQTIPLDLSFYPT